ncbi:MAG: hypothetical protein LPJ89_03585 [Hymenobacteraceae bacterium]|nr:hypothetical protein [Hymenobacteraceae bacterium]
MEAQRSLQKYNIFEVVLASFVFISALLYAVDFIIPDSGSNPFEQYYSNAGIIYIINARLTACLLFLVLFFFTNHYRFRSSKLLKFLYLLAAVTIAFLDWYELYYGSTFYYGEVRDKQGLGFPVFSSYMITFVIWKINYSENTNTYLYIKLILTAIINLALYQFYGYVYELWKLWQS